MFARNWKNEEFPLQSSSSVSFVVTSRNDDHGKNMIRRFRLFADSLLQQANKYGLSGELIIVEWNPPSGPRLHDVLDLNIPSDAFTVRFIEVPREAHQAIRNSDVIPLFQMIAKNVGIRRARGEFVVATNPDLLFSDALISFLASQQLRRDAMYRIDRHDVPADPPKNASMDELLDWCEDNVLRVHGKWGSFPPVNHWKHIFRRLSPDNWIATLSQARTRFFRALRRLNFRAGVFRVIRQQGIWNIIKYGGAKFLRLIFYWPLYLTSSALNMAVRVLDPMPKVHTNGCGDFTLLSRDVWLKLRGYPELPLWSMHIDSLLCYMAVASGIREQILKSPQKLFHLEHENSWVVMSPEARLRTFATKPWLDVSLLNEIWKNMYITKQPVKFNDESWGLADRSFEEVLLTRGGKKIVISKTSRLAATGS
jgi:hypothetical protein